MSWIYCQCTSPSCALRFPVEAGSERRDHCPRCAAPTRCEPARQHAAACSADGAHTLPTLSLLLDNVRSSYNVGSLFRSADGVAAAHLYLCGITPTPHNRKVQKTALGAEETVPWSYHSNGQRLAARLRDSGVALWVLETGPGAISLFEIEASLPQNLVLVVGNERAGVDPAICREATHTVCLPIRGQKGTLNVASAAAVALFSLRFTLTRNAS